MPNSVGRVNIVCVSKISHFRLIRSHIKDSNTVAIEIQGRKKEGEDDDENEDEE